ncbi:class III lanthionine synthetase LanKC [Nocardia sp. NPDC055053]
MHAWEVLDNFRQFHSRWFESVDAYSPGDEHASVFRDVFDQRWALTRVGMWYVGEPPGAEMPDQGWKLHISVPTRATTEALRRVFPVLRDEGVTFKFVVDQRITAMVNGKVWPRGSAGKFMAIYPENLDQFHRLGGQLSARLVGFAGPYILSDRRWPGSCSVFYRYGGFRATSVLQLDGMRSLTIVTPDGGQIPDRRTPYWDPPGWAPDPLNGSAESPQSAGVVLGDRFAVTSALAFSSRGGVYLADDRSTSDTVVIKEARPNVEIGTAAADAVDVLAKEHRLLRRLRDTGYYPRPVEFFTEWEHSYLAEEFVAADHLGVFTIRRNPLYWGDPSRSALQEYFATMRGLWVKLAQAIGSAHEHGIVLGDLSFTNVLVDETGTLKIIDLDAAAEEGVDIDVGLFTPGVSGRRAGGGRGGDFAALGAIVFGSVVLVNGITGFHPPARAGFLADLRRDIGLSDDFINVITDLDDVAATTRASDIADRLATVRVLARRTRPRAGSWLRAEIAATVSGVAEYARCTATPDRTDRLFPADLNVFRTNPQCVAFGAAGVLYALRIIDGTVPAALRDWLLARPVGPRSHPPGLYVGQAGIAWVLAEMDCLDEATAVLRSAAEHPLLRQSHDIFYGAAGYGMACLKLWALGAGEEFLDQALAMGEHVESRARQEGDTLCWPGEDGSVRLGYAHGGSGVALFALYLSTATGDRRWLEFGRRALDTELAQAAFRDGRVVGFPELMTADPAGAPLLKSYWDAGSAGVLGVVVRYLAVQPDDALAAWVPLLRADVARKYVVFPQLFHGLAGLGNALLDTWEFAGCVEALRLAHTVAEGVLLFRIDRDEGAAFPGEQALRESADYGTGAAGVGLFLHRLLAADQGKRSGSFNFVVDELLAR